jgi:hypothetical protein
MALRTIFVFALIALLSACGTAPSARKMNAVSIGMTKAEVISVMGRPDSTAAKEGVEYMNYRLATSALDFDESDTSEYFVRFVNGKVDAFGHRGDFDSAGNPIQHVEVQVKQR